MKAFLKRLLIKFLRVSTEEVAEVVKERVKENWPAINDTASLVVDGLVYAITGVADNKVEAIRYVNSRRQLIKVHPSDMEWDSNAKVWRLPGR
jgi:hypothetical protein